MLVRPGPGWRIPGGRSGGGAMKLTAFFPFLRWLPLVNRETLRADAYAGLTGAAIVLPQGVAFATIAGLPPQYGIFTAMVPVIIAALWGSSMVMMAGPTTALSVVVYATLSPLALPDTQVYVELALLLSIMVGVLKLMAAVARLGAVVAFVSHSVMTGFTAAAALLIAVSQVGDALGLTVEAGGTVPDRLARVVAASAETNALSVILALATLAAVVGLQRVSRRLPTFLIALVFGSLLGWVLGAEARGVHMVGALPAALPSFDVPSISFQRLSYLTEGAFAIALIGLLEAVSIGRSFAVRRRERFNANQEIVGQGLSNVVGAFFGGYPSSGSFTRSGVNAEMGARTPLAAVFSAIFLAAIMVMVLPLITHIPVPAMAGLILYVAYRLIDVKEIRHVARSSRSETGVIALTFLAGLFVALDFAIYIGVIASLILFLHKSSQPAVTISAPKLVNGSRKFVDARDNNLAECPQITIIRLDGTLYFGSVEHVERQLRRIERDKPQQRLKVLILKGVGDIDLAGSDLLIDEVRHARDRGGDFHMVAQFPPLVQRLRRLQVIEELGENRLHTNKGDAIDAVVKAADNEICRGCRVRLFHDCARKPGARAAVRELGY